MPLCPESSEFFEQVAVEAGIVFEPVVDQRFGAEVGRDLCEHAGEPRLQRLAADDDIAPVGLEEFLLQQVEAQTEIALEIGEERQAILWATMNEHAVDIDHQHFHADKFPRSQNTGEGGVIRPGRSRASTPLFCQVPSRVNLGIVECKDRI